MAQTIKLKRSAVSGNTPSTSDLELGEIAINTYDGKVFIKKNDGSASVVEVGAADNTKLPLTGGTITGTVVFNSAPTFNTAIAMGSTLNVASSIGIAGTTVIDSSRNLTNIGSITANAISGTSLSIDTLSMNGSSIAASGNMTLDVAGNISLDADDSGHVRFKDGGSQYASIYKTGSGFIIDGTGDLTIDVGGDINLDAAGNQINFKSGGTPRGYLDMSTGGLILRSLTSDADIIFQGTDGSSAVNALILDMSAAGAATFNANVTAPNLVANTAAYIPIVYGGSSSLQLKSNTSELFAQFVNNGAAELYHDNVKKFETTSTGVLVTGHITASGTNNIYVGDNGKFVAGANDDLQIYHTTTGNHSIIAESGSGNLILAADNLEINNAANNENKIVATSDGAVTLYHNNSAKIATTSTGVAVTGSLTTSANLTVSGNLEVTGTTTQTGSIITNSNFTGLSDANSANATDFGFYGKYVESSTTKYAGMYYDASVDNTFKLFCDTQTAPTTTVNESATGYALANLSIAALTTTGAVTGGGLKIDGGTLSHASSNASSITISGGSNATNGMNISLGGSSGSLSQSVVFKQNSSEKMRLDSSGRLLIGTTSTTPGFSTTNGHAFHVGDASHMSRDQGVALVINRGTNDGGILQFRKSGTYIGGIESRAGVVTTLLLNPASGNGAGISGGTKCIVPADESGIIDNDISLGIGTHRFKDLHLAGNANISGNAVITGNLTINGTTTTLNTATLDVEDKNITLNYGSGDTSSTANGAGITIQDAVDASNDATLTWNTSNDTWNFSHLINAPRFIQTSGSENNFYSIALTRSGSGTASPDVYGSSGTLVLGTSSSDPRLALTTSGAAVTGNLSTTGTLTLGDNKHIFLGAGNDGRISFDGNNTLNISAANGTANTVNITANNFEIGGANTLISGVANDSVVINEDSGNISFRVESNNNTSMLFVDGTNDKVGIGTSAPASLLNLSHATAPELRFSRTGTGQQWVQSIDSSGRLLFLEAASTGGTLFTRMSIDDTGEVGIGVTPTSGIQLQLGNAANSSAITRVTNGTVHVDLTASSSGKAFLEVGTSHPLVLATNATERMRIDAAGSIGFNTSNPLRPFDSRNAIQIFGSGGYTELMLRGRAGTAQNLGAFHFSIRSDVGGDNDDLMLLRFTGGNSPSYAGTSMHIRNDNGHVGIGTNTGQPSSLLHVVGGSATIPTLSSSYPLTISNNGNSGLNIISSGTTNAGQINFGDSGDADVGRIRYDHGDNSMRFTTNATEYMRITSAGRVSVGTSTPARTFHVVSSDYSVARLERTGSGGGVSLEFRNGDGNIWGVSNDGDEVLRFYYAGVNRLQVTSGGAVRFNSAYSFPTADGASGQALVTDGSGNVTFGAVSAGAATSMVDADGDTKIQVEESSDEDIIRFDTAGSERMMIKSDGSVGINSTTPNQKLYVNGIIGSVNEAQGSGQLQLQGYGNSGFINFNGSSNLNFRMGSGYSTRMTLTSGGNLGIGTTAPSKLLHVKTSGTDARIYSEDANGTMILGQSSNADVWSTANTAMRFATNNTERMRITSAGKVGIGTTSPQSLLHIHSGDGGTYTPNVNHDDLTIEGSGNIGLQLFSPNSNYQYIAFGDPDSANAGYIRYHHGSNSMVFRTANSDRVTVDSSGNVGIGTTAPGEKLSIATDTDVSAEIGRAHVGYIGHSDYAGFSHIDRNTTSAYALLQGAAGQTYINSASGQPIRFRINNVDTMILTSSGNLGIGTTAPAALLHAHGATEEVIRIDSGNTGAIHFFEGSTRRGIIGYSNGSSIASNADAGDMVLRAESGKKIHLAISATSKLVVDSSGNVGIGTTAPTARLDVRSANGGVHSRGQLYLTNTDSHAINQGSQISLGGTYSGTSDTYLGSIAARKENATSGDYAGYLQFGTRPSGSANVERMRITSSGKVGIGTTAPAKTVEISYNDNTTNIGGNLSGGPAGPGLLIKNTNTNANIYANLDFRANNADGRIAYKYNSINDGDFHFITDNNDSIETKLIIKNTGNVGIGTTAPNTPIHVASGSNSSGLVDVARFQNTGTSVNDGARIQLTAGTSTSGAGIGCLGDNLNSAHLVFHSGGNTERMRIDSSGNVGIGTSSISAKITLADHTTAAGGIKFRSAASSVSLWSSGSGNLNTDRSFNIGSRLRLVGGQAAADPDIHFTGAASGTGFSRAANDITFITGAQERMRISGAALLVGKTALNNGTAGVEASAAGFNATVSGDTVSRLNRLSSDGEILRFQKNTATVGSIATTSGRLSIGSNDVGLFFDSTNERFTPIHQTNQADRDGAIDLGYASSRFKDLYLSGTANALVGSFGDNVSIASSGVLGVTDSDLVVYNPISGHSGLRFGAGFISPTSNSGTSTSGAVDLGQSGVKFKDLHLSGTANIAGEAKISSTITLSADNTTLTSTTATAVASFSATTYGGAKLVITAKDGVNRQITEMLVTHDGTTAIATQYATINTSTELATYDVDINGGNVRVIATSASSNSTIYRVAQTLLEA